ncbi:hypothetical protein ACIG0D_05780 [Streptomyces sp. NPDC052773]|uniref:hypothetical protein n=1 Tax=Streptomyces sp. NPDC052773 TaxID=3365693 RepID=UPI0037D37EDD
MTPTLYGYASVPGMDAAALPHMRRRLAAFAGRRGFALMDVFAVQRPGQRLGVWCELLWDCQVFGVHDIVIPSLSHMNPCEALARFMCQDLAARIGGRVWIVGQRRPVVAPAEEVGVMAG